MNINTPNECYNFLVGNGLVRVCQEAQNFVACMDILLRMCSCDPPQAKQSRWNQCTQLYVNFAQRAPVYKDTLLNKTSDGILGIYLNKQLLADIRR
jgi:hypothetical protein